jgi:hypothetical protein
VNFVCAELAQFVGQDHLQAARTGGEKEFHRC